MQNLTNNELHLLADELARLRVVEEIKGEKVFEDGEFTRKAKEIYEFWYNTYYNKMFVITDEKRPSVMEVAKYLTFANRWRRGQDDTFRCPGYPIENMPNPKTFGKMIEYAIFYLIQFENENKDK